MNVYELLRPKRCVNCNMRLGFAVFATLTNNLAPLCRQETEHTWS